MALVFALVLALPASGDPTQAPSHVVLAAGDIGDCKSSGDERTAALLDRLRGSVLALGDTVYEGGSIEDYRACYAPSWGRHKRRTRPAPGNHEYRDEDASGYFSYYGAAAGPGHRGYYSFDVGAWHIVSLNSERDTTAGGAQVRWLKRDLARTPADCVLAYWHRPRWSAGRYFDDDTYAPFWNALYDAGADVVLAGHDHSYQRFARLDKLGEIDKLRGIRSFVVGTGGRRLSTLRSHPRRQAANDRTFGVLQLTLRPKSYTWRFIAVAGQDYRDGGSTACSPPRR
jgi:acid phosphatase type 7